MGIHVAFFAERVALTPEQVLATVRGDANDPVWGREESLLIGVVDELHDTADISDQLWSEFAKAFSVEQVLEVIALVGFYHRFVLRERVEASSGGFCSAAARVRVLEFAQLQLAWVGFDRHRALDADD